MTPRSTNDLAQRLREHQKALQGGAPRPIEDLPDLLGMAAYALECTRKNEMADFTAWMQKQGMGHMLAPIDQQVKEQFRPRDTFMNSHAEALWKCWQAGAQGRRKFVPPAPECQHLNTHVGWDYLTCKDCGAFCPADREWGIARGMWFENRAHAEFYKKNGCLPEAPGTKGGA